MRLPEPLKWWLRTLTRSGRRKWLDHELAADGPRGVRIVHADGRVSECTLMRDPEDRGGRAQWIAVPPEGTMFVPPGDSLHVDYLPARTEVTLALPLILAPRPSFTCPRCGRSSANPNDVRERYCGACHDWTGEQP